MMRSAVHPGMALAMRSVEIERLGTNEPTPTNRTLSTSVFPSGIVDSVTKHTACQRQALAIAAGSQKCAIRLHGPARRPFGPTPVRRIGFASESLLNHLES